MRNSNYVKTPEEICKLLAVYAEPKFFAATTMNFLYETHPDAIAALLPPPLQATGSSVVTVSSSLNAQSNCIRDFAGTMVLVPCQYQGVEGMYIVHQVMDTDRAIIFGRELMGEPKKYGVTTLAVNGSRIDASAERFGQRYITVTGELERDVDVTQLPTHMSVYFFKFMPACDGSGLEFDPILVRNRARVVYHWIKEGRGEICFKKTLHDHVHELECLRPVALYYGLLDITGSSSRVATVSKDAFLPYAFANIDNYLLLDNLD
jgi:acetoacetate decarboxylase